MHQDSVETHLTGWARLIYRLGVRSCKFLSLFVNFLSLES